MTEIGQPLSEPFIEILPVEDPLPTAEPVTAEPVPVGLGAPERTPQP